MIDVSIVIVNYKTPELTLNCVASVFAFTKNVSFEVIVVDNNSEDGLAEKIQERFPSVIFKNTNYNAGFSRANNAGAAMASGRFILLLNSDTLLLDDVISQSVSFLEENPSYAAISVNMLNIQGIENFVDPNFNLYGTLKYAFVYPENKLVEYVAKTKIEQLKKSLKNKKEDYLLGAYVLCKKTDFDAIGRMDENLFLYGEDLDLSCKLAKIGHLATLKDLKIIHLEGGSSDKTKDNITFYSNNPQMQLSNLYFIRKWMGSGIFILIMLNYWLFIPIYFIIRLVKALLKFKFEEFKAPLQFSKQTIRWSSYFFSILLQKNNFYKY